MTLNACVAIVYIPAHRIQDAGAVTDTTALVGKLLMAALMRASEVGDSREMCHCGGLKERGGGGKGGGEKRSALRCPAELVVEEAEISGISKLPALAGIDLCLSGKQLTGPVPLFLPTKLSKMCFVI